MKMISKNLLAANQVILLVERSKAHAENIIDDIPGLFLIFDESYRILKCNHLMGKITGKSTDKLIGMNTADLFAPESWKIFASEVKKLDSSNEPTIEFELPIDFDSVDLKYYFWRVSKFDAPNRHNFNLYSAMGLDITKLHLVEQKMANLFNTLPVGILMIGPGGIIEENYTANTERLLDRNNLLGESFKDLLLKPAIHFLSAKQAKAVESFDSFFGKNPVAFELKSSELPTQISYSCPTSNKNIYLGLKYQPIVTENQIDKIMVIIEDRTSIVKAEEARKAQAIEDEKSINRILQIKRLSKRVLPISTREMDRSSSNVEKSFATKDLAQLKRALHGFKGNANICGFNAMAELAQKLEDEIKAVENDPTAWETISERLQKVTTEWAELKALIVALNPDLFSNQNDSKQLELRRLFDQYNKLVQLERSVERDLKLEHISLAMNSHNFEPFESIVPLLEEQCQNISKSLKKKVRLKALGSDTLLDSNMMSNLREILLHLINNSLAHGIEDPATRDQAGKPQRGLIEIGLLDSSGILNVGYRDDGAGANYEKIRKTAITSKLLTIEEALSANKQKLLELLFSPGFSTKTEVDKLAGRGVGMDAIVDQIKKRGGTYSVESEPGQGFSFLFKWPLSRIPIRKRLHFTPHVITRIIKSAEIESGDKIAFKGKNNLGLMICDAPKLSMTVSAILNATLIATGADGKLSAEVQFQEAGLCNIQLKGIQDPLEAEDSDFKKFVSFYREILSEHGGGFKIAGGVLDLSFGSIINVGMIPNLDVLLLGPWSPVEQIAIKSRIDGILKPVGIKCSIIDEEKLVASKMAALPVYRHSDGSRGTISMDSHDDHLRKMALEVIGTNIGISEFEGD